VGELNRSANGFFELRLVERDDVVELRLEDRECQVEGHARGHSFRERIHTLGRDARRTSP
jgi:hypothetical protein